MTDGPGTIESGMHLASRIGEAYGTSESSKRNWSLVDVSWPGARPGKNTVYGLMDSRATKPTGLVEAAVEYCASTYGATVTGPPAPYDVEIVVVTVALVGKHSARRESRSALPWPK